MTVVANTTTNSAANSESLTTPRPRPTPKKTRPTSPRGTMPIPTASRSAHRPAASPATSLPMIAQTVNSKASASVLASRTYETLTCMPTYRKKIGARKRSSGASRWETVVVGSSSVDVVVAGVIWSVRTRPAANAPTIAASPIDSANQAKPKARANGKRNSPLLQSSLRKSDVPRAAIRSPSKSTAPTNRMAVPSVAAICQMLNPDVAAIRDTTASRKRP
mgnify:CR=1 FL=1